MNAQVQELAKIIDRSDAAIMLADVEDGYSLAKASQYLTTRQYKREDFVTFRAEHGDIATTACIAELAA